MKEAKVRRQDILLSLLYCVGYSAVRNFALRLRRAGATRFLTFHDVPDSAAERFESNLSYLKRHTNVISLAAFMEGNVSDRKINVVITFDDGFRGWVKTALPILKRLQLPATFFVSSGFVGLSQGDGAKYAVDRLRLPASAAVVGLSEQDVLELDRAGFTIGGHTASHADLASIDDTKMLMRELTEDKLALERMLGRSIDFFAYPFGSHRNRTHSVQSLVAAAGYKAATTTLPGFNHSTTDRYLLKREIMDAGMPGLVFRARVQGNTDGAQSLGRWAKRFVLPANHATGSKAA
jgi:peptidoglycan/xylan/chitin deacetylase (PgdA/CDA1 family)